MLKTLKDCKEKISNYECQSSNLLKENQILKSKNDLTFEQLTPRPSFQKVFY